MFKKLITHPAYIFKFAIYLLFICFAIIFYFSDMLATQDKSLRNLYSALLLLYGGYRMIRTYQDFQAEIRNEEQ